MIEHSMVIRKECKIGWHVALTAMMLIVSVRIVWARHVDQRWIGSAIRLCLRLNVRQVRRFIEEIVGREPIAGRPEAGMLAVCGY